MEIFQLIMRVLAALLTAYISIITVWIILSWFRGSSEFVEQIRGFLGRVVDPYMNRFRGIGGLQFGMFDFSPWLGIALLIFIRYIVRTLGAGAYPTLGQLLAVALQLVWGLFAFLLTVVAIIMIFRLITLFVMKGSRPNWIDRLDAFLFPRVSRMMGLFTTRTVSYPLALGVTAAALLALRLGIDQLLMRVIYPFIMRL